MPEANLARLGSAVPMVVVSRDCAGAPGGGAAGAVVAPCRWPCDYLISLRTASHSLDTGNGTLFSGKMSLKCILKGGSDGKKAFPGQDIRGMYSPAPFFTAFHGSNHT